MDDGSCGHAHVDSVQEEPARKSCRVCTTDPPTEGFEAEPGSSMVSSLPQAEMRVSCCGEEPARGLEDLHGPGSGASEQTSGHAGDAVASPRSGSGCCGWPLRGFYGHALLD